MVYVSWGMLGAMEVYNWNTHMYHNINPFLLLNLTPLDAQVCHVATARKPQRLTGETGARKVR
jgi:hypothetical protein